MAASRSVAVPGPVVHGIDRIVGNIETGRFERSLSALTAAGAVIAAAEIFFEHDWASFGNKMMWIPWRWARRRRGGSGRILSQRMAKTVLPIASAVISRTGFRAPTCTHEGSPRNPVDGGTRYNIEMGPPLLAPLLVTMVGGMGLLAAVLRREK